MSVIESLTMNSKATGKRATYVPNNSIVGCIEIGFGNRYHSGIKNGCRVIEVWLHLKRPITPDECEEFKTIIENNNIEPDDIKYNDYYDYHLSFFPKAWMEDIWPKLETTM